MTGIQFTLNKASEDNDPIETDRGRTVCERLFRDHGERADRTAGSVAAPPAPMTTKTADDAFRLRSWSCGGQVASICADGLVTARHSVDAC